MCALLRRGEVCFVKERRNVLCLGEEKCEGEEKFFKERRNEERSLFSVTVNCSDLATLLRSKATVDLNKHKRIKQLEDS